MTCLCRVIPVIYLLILQVQLLAQIATMSHVDTADMASSAVIGAEMTTSDTTPSNSPIGGATPSSSSVSSAAKPVKNVDLLNNSGMGDLKATKPYKREPLHRFVNFVLFIYYLRSATRFAIHSVYWHRDETEECLETETFETETTTLASLQ